MLYDGTYSSTLAFPTISLAKNPQRVKRCQLLVFQVDRKESIPHPDGARTTTGSAQDMENGLARTKVTAIRKFDCFSPLLALKLVPMAAAGIWSSTPHGPLLKQPPHRPLRNDG
jgi:hypothetical protein